LSEGVARAAEDGREAAAGAGPLAAPARALAWLNDKIVVASMGTLILAALVLTLSVVMRYFLRIPTDWQDETSVFLLVGAIFMSAAYVQSYRGHVGIEALAGLLPRRLNAGRLLLVDLVSFLFTAFFSWKSWTLLREAVVEHQTTDSTWGPPLWIPYSTMAVGMTLLSLQILLQVATRLGRSEADR